MLGTIKDLPKQAWESIGRSSRRFTAKIKYKTSAFCRTPALTHISGNDYQLRSDQFSVWIGINTSVYVCLITQDAAGITAEIINTSNIGELETLAICHIDLQPEFDPEARPDRG